MSENEVGGFGITKPDDLLFITDIALVKQDVTSVSVRFDDVSVADFFDEQTEAGRKPEQFARIWIHSHPGASPEPSATDEKTFERVFGKCDWSVMFILAQDGSSYARLHFASGPKGDVKLPVYVDYQSEFEASDFKLWKKQYKANVTEEVYSKLPEMKDTIKQTQDDLFGSDDFEYTDAMTSHEILYEIDSMDPQERELFLEELSTRSQFWEESEVFYE
jgi:proteasome lid subunit RPN8/RPN11